MQRNVMPTKRTYTQACRIEQGRRSKAFELSNVRSVTWMELEEVIPQLISAQVLNGQISF
jgi:hypothetical protein